MAEEDWDPVNMEKLKDECLKFVRILFIDFYGHKYTKICTFIYLVFHVPIWIEQYYQYLKTFDILMVAQYGPVSFIFLFAFISMLLPTICANNVRLFFWHQKKLFWSFNTASEELRRTMLTQAKYITYIAKINLALGLLTYVAVIVKVTRDNNWENIYQIMFIKKHFPRYSGILIVIFYVSLSYLILSMLMPIYAMMYVTAHIFFQSSILFEYIRRIIEKYPEDKELFYNESYQKRVFQKLRFCIMRGMTIKRITNQQIAALHPLMVLFTVLGMLLVVCFVGSWQLNINKYYPSLFLLIITSGLACLIIVEVGQWIEEKSLEEYCILCALPWYTFDLTNQKIFLCVLLNAGVPITLSPFREFPINRALIVKFYKVACSVYAVAVHMEKNIPLTDGITK